MLRSGANSRPASLPNSPVCYAAPNGSWGVQFAQSVKALPPELRECASRGRTLQRTDFVGGARQVSISNRVNKYIRGTTLDKSIHS